MNEILDSVLKSPLAVGYVLSMVMNAVHSGMVSLDKSDLAAKYGSQMHILAGVLTFLATAITLLSNGQLESLDLSSAQTFLATWLPMIIGSKAATVTLKK